jgi:aminoglycoside phosphotransferase (APT) family kinase protein
VHEALFRLVPPVTLPSQRDRFTTKIRLTAARIDRAHAEALELLPAASGPARLCHGDLHPSNIILSPRGPVLVDWFDASRGDPIADVARSSVILLADGADAPPHLPGADRATLERLTAAYLARLREHREIDEALLARWQAVNAVARMAEGVRRDALIGVWTRFHDQAALHAAAN